MKKIIIALVVVALIAAAVGTMGGKKKSTEESQGGSEPAVSSGAATASGDRASNNTTPAAIPSDATASGAATPASTEAPATTEAPTTTQPPKEVYQVGDRVTEQDLTLVYVSSGEYTSDNQFMQPGEGNKYIFLEFYAEYNGKTSNSLSYFDFDGYADGYAVDQKYTFEEALNGKITAGRWNQGKIYFEVPQNAQQIEIEYKANLLSKKVIKFLYEGTASSGFVPEPRREASADALKPGESAEKEGVRITYLGCGVHISDNMFLQPEEGCEYLYFEVEVENTANSEKNISSLNFECYGDGKYCKSHAAVRDDALSATISVGRKVKGTVLFEVPRDAEVIELEFFTSLILGEKLIFTFVR